MRRLHSDRPLAAQVSSPTIEPISMRIADACRFTGISRSTLYVLIAKGDIQVAKVGRSTLVTTDSLKAFLAGQL